MCNARREARSKIQDPRSQISNQLAVVGAGAAGPEAGAKVRLLTQAGSKPVKSPLKRQGEKELACSQN